MSVPAGRFEQVQDREGAIDALNEAYIKAVGSADYRAAEDYCLRLRDAYMREAMASGGGRRACASAWHWNREAQRMAGGRRR